VTEPGATHPFADRPVPDWFAEAGLGILVHWGPSSVPGWAPLAASATGGEPGLSEEWFVHNPYAEWYQNSIAIEGSPSAEHHRATWGGAPYERFGDDFARESGAWSADDWAETFAACGARYVVITTKHHDGYLLWPSARRHPRRDGWQSERDLVGELAAAVRARGMRFGTYYSGGLDWTFGGLPIRSVREMIAAIPRDDEYRRYVEAHWAELIDRYEPDILWNDIAHPPGGDHHRLFSAFYERVPDGVVNDRFDFLGARAGTSHCDFLTPEYSTLDASSPKKWETVRGIAHSFGFNRAETDDDLPPGDEVVRMLADVVGAGGNLLLGVGPRPDGSIPEIQRARLAALGTARYRSPEN
jgi:alpha-L-fucosidase